MHTPPPFALPLRRLPHKPPSRKNRFGRVAPSAWGEVLYCHLSIHILTSQRTSPPHTPRHNSTHEQPKHGERTYNGITPTRSLKRSQPSHEHGNARKTDLLPLLLAHRKPTLPHSKTAPLVRNGEAVSAYDASSTPQTSDISHTPNRAQPLCQIRQPKSYECDILPPFSPWQAQALQSSQAHPHIRQSS